MEFIKHMMSEIIHEIKNPKFSFINNQKETKINRIVKKKLFLTSLYLFCLKKHSIYFLFSSLFFINFFFSYFSFFLNRIFFLYECEKKLIFFLKYRVMIE